MLTWKKLSVLAPLWSRGISLSAAREGKRNFRKFILPSRGTKQFKEMYAKGQIKVNYGPSPRRELPITETTLDGKVRIVPEKIPELIVPDLTGCEFKPYVSYQTRDVIQSPFTAKDLFDAVYKRKITSDFVAGKLGSDGEPLQPSEDESMTAQQAFNNARKTGSDIF